MYCCWRAAAAAAAAAHTADAIHSRIEMFALCNTLRRAPGVFVGVTAIIV